MRFKEKHGPHFHVEYAGAEALISIRNGQVLGGKLPAAPTGWRLSGWRCIAMN